MTRRPLSYTLRLQQHAETRQKVRLPFSATSVALYASVYNRAGTQKLFNLGIEWITQSGTDTGGNPYCEFYLTSTAAEPGLALSGGHWELLAVSPAAPEVEYWLEGAVIVESNNTVPPG